MSEYAKLFLQYLPYLTATIKYLEGIPDAVKSLQELYAYGKRVSEIVKKEKLTPEDEAALDAFIDSLPDQPQWKSTEPGIG